MSKTANKNQSDILLKAMELRPDIARGWYKGSKEELNRVWRNLEVELNSAGPPTKTIGEWKKVWCDQKKYVRHKAAHNLKHSRGTGGGPNVEQKLSAGEEAIYSLISMKESVEGVARPFGLGYTSPTEPESAQPPLMEFDDGECLQNVEETEDTPQKAPPKKVKVKAGSGTQGVLEEELCVQKKILGAMVEQHQMSKKIYRSIDRLCDIKKDELKEKKRHNTIMEQLRLREVEDKIEKNRRVLELEELKVNGRRM